MKKLFIIIMVLCSPLATLLGQTVVGGVITSGATNAPLRGGYGMQGSVGQPMVGEAGISPQVRSGIMSVGDRSQQNYETTLISVAETVKKIGDTFALDVNYGAPCAFFQDNVAGRDWELKVSFNRTVLEPLQYDAIVDDGERYTITVSGRAVSQNGVVTQLKLMGRLGNDSTTDVRVESFRWKDVPRQWVRATPGSVTLRGLCNTYGQTRLLKGPSTMSIIIAPNPVTGSAVTLRTYAETTVRGKLIITDIHGNLIVSRDEVEAGTEWPMVSVTLPDAPAGTYTVTFITADDAARTTMVKLP